MSARQLCGVTTFVQTIVVDVFKAPGQMQLSTLSCCVGLSREQQIN